MKKCSILNKLLMLLIIGCLLQAQAALADAGNPASVRTVVVGSAEEAAFVKTLYEKYPDSRKQLDQYRQAAAKLPYGTEVQFNLYVQEGEAAIHWQEVGLGIAGGAIAITLWNAFGGELLCAVGVAPACACVGPQC